MRRLLSGPTIWILFTAWLAVAAPGHAQVTQADRDSMVDAHNVVRGTAIPYPVPALAPVSWSAVLETSTQIHADLCVYGHSGTPGVGENIYAFASIPDPVPKPPPSFVVVTWESERAFYAYATNTCSPPPIPGTCGHYTQEVWRSSTSIGCGVKYCEINSPFGPGFPHWYFWVCQYSPAGNVNPAVNRPYLCDYDSNGSFESVCVGGIWVDGFEIGTARWSAKTP
jgi:pathogenesis-related protein 1